jgi:hypothetical protein
MKKNILTVLFILFTTLAFAQAKKPTIMVIPSDAWCIDNGYIIEFDNQGKVVKVPDYKKAVQENTDLLSVISKINDLMADRGFPLVNLESSLKNLENEAAEDAMTTTKSGAEINESPTDKLKKVAKADLLMQMTWTVNTTGPKKSVGFILQGLDAYTDKQIAGASGTGQPSFTAEIPVLLEEAVLSHLDNFNVRLQNHFDDMVTNGREVKLSIKTFNSWDHDLQSEDFGDEELGTLIENWVADNTVQGRFNTANATENMMLFEQVRIPLYNNAGRAIDARRWADDLRKYLKNTHQIESRLTMKGLGQAQLILGEK